MIMPALQKPHWNPCASRNACCIGCKSPLQERPSMVATSRLAAHKTGFQRVRGGHVLEAQLYGPQRGSGDSQKKFLAFRAASADHQSLRAPQMGQSETAECIAFLQRRCRQKDRTQQFARSEHVCVV